MTASVGDFNSKHGHAKARTACRAEKIINELETMWKAHYFSPFVVAVTHAGAGHNDEAFAWLTKAYESRDPQLIWLMVEPQCDGLRSDSRFQVLARQMGITPRP
jgi:hypothetical protein